MKSVIIFTDGSCDTQSGRGGWGYLLNYEGYLRAVSGFEANTTNNRMELSAAVYAIEALTEPCDVNLVTDSNYLKKAFTDGWLANWQRNGWQTSNRKPVKNKDLWLQLLQLDAKHDIGWQWTKGHANSAENNLVDKLALEARKSSKGQVVVHDDVSKLLLG